MDKTRRRKRRWLRWLGWAGALLACWIFVVPTLQALSMRHRVVSAVRSAQTVRLEGFDDNGYVLARVELDTQQREAIASSLPFRPDIGIPGLIAYCFVPHHRVVARDAAGQDVEFQVCFECDEVRFQQGPIRMTPLLWRSSLRRLFTDHKIPVRDASE